MSTQQNVRLSKYADSGGSAVRSDSMTEIVVLNPASCRYISVTVESFATETNCFTCCL